MYIGIALLTDSNVHNLGRSITFNLNKKYNTVIESALLPQHISLKQSFPYKGDIRKIETYLYEFFASIKPIKICIEKIEIKLLSEAKILAWFDVIENKELKGIHKQLCSELKEKFDIKPLGFDGSNWKFHSTLTCSDIDKNYIKELFHEYNNMKISLDFQACQAVMFCCVGDNTKTSEYFSYKIFNIDNFNEY